MPTHSERRSIPWRFRSRFWTRSPSAIHRRSRGAVCQPDAPWLEPLLGSARSTRKRPRRSPSRRTRGIYYCFGCHAGGGVINFIMQIEGLDYPDAVRFLAKRAGLEVPEDENYHSQYQKQERLWALCKRTRRGSSASSCSPPSEPRRRRTYKSARSAWRQSSASGLASARTRGRSLRTR